MPIEGQPLIIEPGYAGGAELAKIGQKEEPEEPLDYRVRNKFYSRRSRCDVVVMEEADGRITHVLIPAFHHFTHDLMTFGASDAWGIEQESKALQLLGTLVSHRQMKHYLLTGMFLETSKRSRITYLFRKLKPTIAIDARTSSQTEYVIGETEARQSGDNSRIIAALCMHPIAYYEGSWAGAMTPTDDVIAHLMLMRGDEPMFWRRANQHPAYRPEAGL